MEAAWALLSEEGSLTGGAFAFRRLRLLSLGLCGLKRTALMVFRTADMAPASLQSPSMMRKQQRQRKHWG